MTKPWEIKSSHSMPGMWENGVTFRPLVYGGVIGGTAKRNHRNELSRNDR